MGTPRERAIATRVLWVALLMVLTLTLVALQSSHRLPARAKGVSPSVIKTDVGEEASVGTTRHIPGFAYCDPMTATEQAPCERVVVTVPLLDELLGRKTLSPSDTGLPLCPTGVSDPGFDSLEAAATAMAGHEDDPPGCMADPHYAVTNLFLTPAGKARFLNSYQCLGTNESPCDLKQASN